MIDLPIRLYYVAQAGFFQIIEIWDWPLLRPFSSARS